MFSVEIQNISCPDSGFVFAETASLNSIDKELAITPSNTVGGQKYISYF